MSYEEIRARVMALLDEFKPPIWSVEVDRVDVVSISKRGLKDL